MQSKNKKVSLDTRLSIGCLRRTYNGRTAVTCLENLFNNFHSHDEHLWKVSLKFLQ